MNTTQTKSNYSLFLDTVQSLASSQGFYSRLAAQIKAMDEIELLDLEQSLNALPQFKDSLDVVLWLEQ